MTLDETHDPALRSWVAGANGHPDFPIQNLPLGVFTPPAGGAPRAGIAIGEMILDLDAAGLSVEAPLLAHLAPGPRRALRRAASALLAQEAPEHPEWLHPAADCAMHLPARIGDYTDFYAGLHHAEKCGRLFRPDAPLMPNYQHLPVGYHGRASSVMPSGTTFRRPSGQRSTGNAVVFEPSARLDYELELGIWIAEGNPIGEPVPIAEADARVAGFCLLNDWSARDIQAWEYQPLGPFLGKSFCTTISPWIVTPEAMAPFRAAQPERPAGDPTPLPHLLDARDQAEGALALQLDIWLATPAMREAGVPPHRLASSHSRHLYWTPAQFVAHHTSNGCPLQPGDLFGTGTISGPAQDESGCLLEQTRGGAETLHLPNGESRTFLQDGDEITLTARAAAPGRPGIGFGPCAGRVLPAL
jgi:fumarylacetoacetase